MKKLTLITVFCLALLLMLVGCNNTDEAEAVEYTAENNADIAALFSELKELYSLAEVSENRIELIGTKTKNESLVNHGSIIFDLYFDTDDWNKGVEAARYALKKLYAMCSDTSVATVCNVYLNEGGYYVSHRAESLSDIRNPEDVILSVTEFDSESLRASYENLGKEYGMSEHFTWENKGIKYIKPCFELNPGIFGHWYGYAFIDTNEDCSVDELIGIGDRAQEILGNAAKQYSSENDITITEVSSNIQVCGNKYIVSGKSEDGSEILIWSCIKNI